MDGGNGMIAFFSSTSNISSIIIKYLIPTEPSDFYYAFATKHTLVERGVRI